MHINNKMHNIGVFLVIGIMLASSCGKTIDGEESLTNTRAILEVTCTIFSIFYECADVLSKTDDVLIRFSNVCNSLSVLSTYIRSKCIASTLEEILEYFNSNPVPSMSSKAVQDNPTKIVNFVMSSVFNSRAFHRTKGNVHRAILKLKESSCNNTDCQRFRTGYIARKHREEMLDDILIEISCSVFTIAKDCSHQYDNCDKTCQQLLVICNKLSLGSKVFGLTCHNDTILEIITLYRPDWEAPGDNVTNASYFWGDVLNSDPVDFIQRLVHGVLQSKTISNEIHLLRDNVSKIENQIIDQDLKDTTSSMCTIIVGHWLYILLSLTVSIYIRYSVLLYEL